MLEITIKKQRLFNEKTSEFIHIDEQTLLLEHSLVSLSKWERKWHKPFISSDKTKEEILDYIKMMTITKNVDPLIYDNMSEDILSKIKDYIDNPMTATTFSNHSNNGSVNNEIITAEIIYYWMITLQIPVEFEKWHINSLLTLIRVCEIKNSPPKKRSSREIASRTAALNAARRQQYAKKG